MHLIGHFHAGELGLDLRSVELLELVLGMRDRGDRANFQNHNHSDRRLIHF